MIYEWSLRNELLSVSHRWPWVVLFCIIGSLMGILLSLLWPSPHRAVKEIYVGLDVYQPSEDRNVSEHAGQKFYNADDYKNWQMASLNTVIYTDVMIDETLRQLREMDAYWQGVSSEELASMLHAYWRNAGKWRLVAESDDPLRATQAVLAWHDVIVERVNWAIIESEKAILIDRQYQAMAQLQAELLARTNKLTFIRDELQNWLNNTPQASIDQPLDQAERDQLWHPLAQAEMGSAWAPVLVEFPSPQAPGKDYIPWVQRAVALLNLELQSMQSQVQALGNSMEVIEAQYAEASQKSLGLSSRLRVDKIADALPEQTVVRPSGLLMLIGGCLGFFLYIAAWAARISLRKGT